MNSTLLKVLILSVPVAVAFSYSVVLFRRRARWSTMQLVGATCLAIVVFAHFCEALRVFPWMRWGAEHSAGHYLDLSSAALGLILFPAGYLLHLIDRRRL